MERQRLRWKDNIWMDCLIAAEYKWPEGTDRGWGYLEAKWCKSQDQMRSVATLTKKDEMSMVKKKAN